MRRALTLAAACSFTLAACSDQSRLPTRPSTTGGASLEKSNIEPSEGSEGAEGAVFTATNAIQGNAVVAFARAANGTLTYAGTFPTGGLGMGGTIDPLQSQFSLALDRERDFLFVVNAGSNDISTFRVHGARLTLIGRTNSGGLRPVSVGVSPHGVYVLNTNSNSVSGFTRGEDGGLTPNPAASRALSPGASGGAEIRVSPDGRALAVTERLSNTIDTYRIAHDGSLSAPVSNVSSGQVPFGFDYTARGDLVVSEAGSGSASAYELDRNGTLDVESAAVSTGGQKAPCWLIVTSGGGFAYTANTGSGTISGFAVSKRGELHLITAGGVTGSTGAGSVPLDLDLSRGSRFLYVLEAGAGKIGVFAVGHDGSLSALPAVPGLAANAGFQGMAAY